MNLRMDTLERFPLVWPPTCEKTQKMIFAEMRANDKNDHDAADILCDVCKSVVATHCTSGAVGDRRAIKPRRTLWLCSKGLTETEKY
jgi:hypothetical protein